MEINLGENIIIKRGSRPTPLSKYEVNKQIVNSIPYPIQSDLNKNTFILDKCKKFIKTDLDFKFTPAKKGDLLMSSSCDIGNVAILGIKEAFIDDKFFRLEVSNNVKINYLKYWIIKNKKEISDLGYGTTFKMLYIEPFKNFLNEKFIPNLEVQQEIINIIEPKEDLFLKYHSIIDISNLDVFKESWYNLINIIEPFEEINRILNLKLNELDFIVNLFSIFTKEIGLMKNMEIKFQKGISINSSYLENKKTDKIFINISAINNKVNKWVNNNFINENINYGDVVLSLDGTIGLVNNFLKGVNGYGYKVFSSEIKNYQIYYSLLHKKNKAIMIENSHGSVIKHSSKSINHLLLFDFSDILFELTYEYTINIKKQIEVISKIIKNLVDLYI